MSSSPRIQIYTTMFCGFCRAAKRLLDDLGIPYEDIDVTGRYDLRQKVVAETGWPTVPVVLLDGELVGGFTELSALHRKGGLDALLPSS